MFKKKYRVDYLAFNTNGGLIGHGYQTIEFYPFFNTQNIDDLVSDLMKGILEDTGLKEVKICIQHITPYNLRNWR
jgi:hypothetical protein